MSIAFELARFRHDLSSPECEVSLSGFSLAERSGRWTNGAVAEIRAPLRHLAAPFVYLAIELRPFILPDRHPRQTVRVSVNGGAEEVWELTGQGVRQRVMILEWGTDASVDDLHVRFAIPTCAAPFDFGINGDKRLLGVLIKSITILGMARRSDQLPLEQLGTRRVGPEASKTWDDRMLSGFWSKYIQGPNVLDIGFRGGATGVVEPIVEGAIGVELDYPGYDGTRLPFADESQDAVYSSHCLEHIPGYIAVIQDWYRVLRTGGHIIAVVPSAHLYERGRRPPSKYNRDHRRFYTPASLLAEFESALVPNSYRVRFLEENDRDYDYSLPPDRHPIGCYEIVLVLQKIATPSWSLRE